MRSWKLFPKESSVAKYVDCYWFLEKNQEDVSFERPKLNPDPAAHLILAETQQRYRYSQGANSFEGHGNHWMFPHCKTIEIDHSKPFLIVGIKFHVGALYSLKFSASQEVLDQVIDIDIRKLFQSDLFVATDVLSDAINTPQICRDKLDNFIKPQLLECYEDKHSELVRRSLKLLSSTSICNIGAALHCSQRTIERSFLKVTGFTLKQCHSMNRLESILEYLYQLDSKRIDWADIAAHFQFSDQPHLIRYLKSTIGVTPGEYARQRDLAIDIYGNFEGA